MRRIKDALRALFGRGKPSWTVQDALDYVAAEMRSFREQMDEYEARAVEREVRVEELEQELTSQLEKLNTWWARERKRMGREARRAADASLADDRPADRPTPAPTGENPAEAKAELWRRFRDSRRA